MIDGKDLSDSELRLVLWKALRKYPTKELLRLLELKETILRTAAAKELHFRPTKAVLKNAINLCSSRLSVHREIGAFVLGQLGTPKMPFRNASIPILVKLLLTDKAVSVRAAAAAALGHLRASKAKIELMRSSSDSNDSVRTTVAYALGSIRRDKDVLRALQNLAKDPHEDVRSWARLGLRSAGQSGRAPES